MTRYEFLTQLDEYLTGNVSDRERLESVQYYTEYIENEVADGKTEEEVLNELGSPYSIGKSIVDAKGNESSTGGDAGIYGYSEYGYANEEEPKDDRALRVLHLDGWKSWVILAVVLVVAFFVLSFVFRIFVALLPVVLVVGFILFLLRSFTDTK